MQSLRGKLFLSGMDENAASLARKWGLGLELTDFCEARKLEEPAAMEAARARCSGIGSLWLHAPFAELSPCAIDPRVREVVMLRFRQTVQTALALGMRTDASAKFEKDIDPMLTVPAVNRACELVEMLGAGEVMDGMIDVLNYVPQPVTVKLEPERINALLGTDIPEADMIEYLRREEVPVVDGMIQVPSWRPDLRVMADIAEEVARYYGYNNIETTLMRGATTMGGYSDAQKLENAAGAAARAMGYSEIITYSFVSPASFDAIRIPADSPLRRTVKLVNPLGEDTSIMRTVILPSMLDILSRNFAFKNKGVKLYEIGKIYLPKDGEKLPDEPKRMIFGTYGEHENFFTLKGEIDAILDQLNVHPATYIADTKNPSYHPGRCADIVIDGKKMGVIGQIHPLVAETYGIGGEVYVAELDFTGLQAVLAPERVFHSLPKFPTVSRDLALVCDEAMTVAWLDMALCFSSKTMSLEDVIG